MNRLRPELFSVYEQASIAWHGLWGLDAEAEGDGSGKAVGSLDGSSEGRCKRSHPPEASEPSSERPAKRQQFEAPDRALVGLQRIYNDIQAKPRSEGQASALQLVHHPSPIKPLVIVLPTSSGKSVLIFSVAAMTKQQTVIVVVPFAALVDDIIERGQAAGLQCEEWIDETSGHELQQLIVVSADRAVQGTFLHYAKGLELDGQLAHVFFDECHVVFTDTSYRERLRHLWTLRYLNCPFTGLTATLMVELEDVLRERLCIDNADIFRRPTARKTIRYQVRDSQKEVPSAVAIEHVRKIQLEPGRGVIYVRSYDTGGVVSQALDCPFYRARAAAKSEVLQQWMRGSGGWIVATGALGTGINIEGIRYVIHVGRPYGLTSFVQQSGRGGRNGEVSESVIITRVENSSGRRRPGITSEYSVEQVDEDAMTEFIQTRGCRRQVLSRYMDGQASGTSCSQTDSVLCDWCKVHRQPSASVDVPTTIISNPEEEAKEEEVRGSQVIARRLQEMEASQERMLKVMVRLQGNCIYCGLMQQGYCRPHTYAECSAAIAAGCGKQAYEQWREGIDLGQYQHCWKCGLSQRVCRRLEEDGWCEFPEVMLPGIFILHGSGHLQAVVETVGFCGSYEADVWEWMASVGEGFGSEWESNWMGTWRQVCQMYESMSREGEDEGIRNLI